MQQFYRLFYVSLVSAVMILCSLNASAQTDIKIGTGTTSNTDWQHPSPFSGSSHATRMQFLYLASELKTAGITAGLINTIKFNVLDLGMYFDPATSALSNYTIKMGETTTASLSSTGWETANHVVYTTGRYLPVAGINTFHLSSPFLWNGTDNLVVELCMEQQEPGFIAATRWVEWTENLPFNGSRTYNADNQGSVCNRTADTWEIGNQKNRPNIIFNWQAVAPCAAAGLNGGNAASTIPSLCSGEEFKLSVTGQTVATGLTYKWQSSSNQTSWTDIPGATQPLLQTMTQSATTYYRAVVTCANGGVANSSSIQVLTPTPTSGNFTINKNKPAGSGNFQSFNDAYNAIRCGINGAVVFDVEAGSGTYEESLRLGKVPGISATNTITFRGNGNTLQAVSATSDDRATIKFDGADYFVFDNLNIKTAAGSNWGYGVQFTNDADSNIIRNCSIDVNVTATNENFAGIAVSRTNSLASIQDAFCDGNQFIGNTINGGYYGIIVTGGYDNPNAGTRIIRNRILNFAQSGIYLASSFNTVIDSNYLSRPARSSSASIVNGIYVSAINTRLTVSKNAITNIFSGIANSSSYEFRGIAFDGAPAISGLEAIVSNNIIYNLSGGGNIYGLYNSASASVHYFYNTISLDGPGTGTSSANFATGFFMSEASGIRFNNNNISVTRDGNAVNTAIQFNTISTANQSDRNNLYVATGTGVRQIGYAGGAGRPQLADWLLASGVDANSMSENPVFADLAAGDLRPANAALNDAGLTVAVSVDITGAARAAKPDIGAFEFTPPPCVTPPTAGKIVLNKTALCVDLPVSISLTGNSTGETQTFQLESADNENGPFTAVGNAVSHSTFSFAAVTSRYYRIKVTCGATSAYSDTVLLTVYPPFQAGTYTINKNKPAGNTNFQSFNAAYSAMDCGISGPVVFDVEAIGGVYNEQLIWGRIKGASATNTITFRGHGDTIRYSSSNTNQRAVVKFNGTSFVTFENLFVDATGTYGFGVQLMNNADYNTFRKCTIRTSLTSTNATSTAGVVINASNTSPISNDDNVDFSDCDNNLFEENTIIGGYYGVALRGNTGPEPRFVSENKFLKNTIRDFYTRGVYLRGTGRLLFEGNTISRPTRTAVGAFYGIYAEGINGDMQIGKNRITMPFGGNTTSTQAFYGMYFTEVYHIQSEPNYIYNNLIYDVRNAGAQHGIYLQYSHYNNFYHNTISLEDVSYTGTAVTNGFSTGVDLNTGITEVKNNLVTIRRGGNGMKYGFNLVAPLQAVNIDRNNYYIKGAGENNYIGYRDQPRATMDEWRIATINKDENSTTADPVYADTAAGNFAPTVAPLNNTGIPLSSVTSDILGIARSTDNPDIGAYEFNLSPCFGGVNAGKATATPNPATAPGLCMGTSITLSLADNSTNGNQTYQWQNAPTADGPWYNVGEATYRKDLVTELFYPYYRCEVTCSGAAMAYSETVLVNRSAPLAAGEYLIKKTGGDFASFAQAVAAMQCGITGAVTFNVAPDTYNEQVVINRIPGATDTSRVTFRRQPGSGAPTLTATAAGLTTNYVLRLNGASYITIDGLNITAASTTNGRVIDMMGTIFSDSIINNTLATPVTTAATTARGGVFASPLKGAGIVISNNTINNGTNGIYIAGTSSIINPGVVVAGNTISGFRQYGVYVQNTDSLVLNNNTINIGNTSSTAYGLYASAIKRTYTVNANTVNISNNTGGAYGIYMTDCITTLANGGLVHANRIIGRTANSGSLTGLYVAGSTNPSILNNTISIATSGFESYGLFSSANKDGKVYNNSVYSTATSYENIAAYFGDNWGEAEWVNIRNNIFAHGGDGIALVMDNKERFLSDYNMLYTSGTTLIRGEWSPMATLQEWNDAADLETNSIVFKPEFENLNSLKPAIARPEVWAMNGRGVQIEGNEKDIENNKRAASFKEGVPDLGAYEFVPTSVPVNCIAQPATPVAGGKQVFMLGTDTVSVITWGATVPTDVKIRRYSGAVPPALEPGTDHMYFYTETETTGTGVGYTLQQHYMDPWRGFIDKESRIRLGKTDIADSWTTDLASAVDVTANMISQSNINHLGKFTGLTDPQINYPSTDTTALMDSTHMGTRFWVSYGHSNQIDDFTLNIGGAAKDADVTVKINGTKWIRHYKIPANTFIDSDMIPATGVSGAKLRGEGWSDKSISVESSEPVTVYARGDGLYTTGSSLILPTGAYGTEYYSLGAYQATPLGMKSNVFSWFNVIADHDSTMVEITPSNPTVGGRAPGQAFIVTLNRGEVYQVMGASASADIAYDLSGSKIRSFGNSSGKCYPIAVFSGNSDGVVDCKLDYGYENGDYMIQQGFPVSGWGTQYLTAPTSRSTQYDQAGLLGPDHFMKCMYRVAVKDPATVVKVNGSPLTGLKNNFYEYWSDQADFIESDKPVMVAQYLPSSSLACTEELGGQAPEIFYLTPLNQGIRKSVFYRNNKRNFEGVGADFYLTLIVPTAGLGSLKLDGSSTFDHTYAHPNKPGYTVVVKHWSTEKATSIVESDSAFTGITYAYQVFASYGYSLGRYTPNLAKPGITNIYDSTGNYSAFNCVGTPFKHSVLLPVQATKIVWKFSSVTNMTPSADSTQDSPVPVETVMLNGTPYYRYEIKHDFIFSATGDYIIPVVYSSSAIDNCAGLMEKMLLIKVVGTPEADVKLTYSGCINDQAQLSATVSAENNDVAEKYKWNFGNTVTSTLPAPSMQYAAAGNYTIKLDVLTKAGCIAKAESPVTAKDVAVFSFVNNNMQGCFESDVVLAVKDPQSGVTYNWYEAATGGASVHSGTTMTVPEINGTKTYYVEAVLNGCTSRPRQEVKASSFAVTGTPVAAVDSIAVNLVRFEWAAVPGVVNYQVSLDGGNTWITPSSGADGLTHTVSGLQGGREVTLKVKAVDPHGCTDGISTLVVTHTLPSEVFAPNAFTPNGDNKNDVFKIEGYVIRSMQLMIFNQWGEKVFESNDQAIGWDGRYKGQMQPSGVYIYVCNMTLLDGSKLVKKGAVNLVR